MLAHMPPMLRDIVQDAVMNELDMEVVDTLGDQEPFLTVLENVRTDVLILGAGVPDDFAIADEVWAKWPRIKILMIAQGGRSAVLHVLRPHRVVLGDVSPQGL
ncbi:MAG TPA: hypothetical protein VEN95_06505, partial [Actinomycetota bacterium]|nr:hypothetical protein [Actinomycetota bacterium]